MTDSETGATLMPRQPISSTRSISTELHHVPSGPRYLCSFSQSNISTTMSLYKLLNPPRPYLISTEYSHLLTLTEKSLKTFCWSGVARWLANELHHFKLWMLQNKQNLTCKSSMFRVGLGSGFCFTKNNIGAIYMRHIKFSRSMYPLNRRSVKAN